MWGLAGLVFNAPNRQKQITPAARAVTAARGGWPMVVSYRPAREEDLVPAMEVIHHAVNHLAAGHGFEGMASAPGTEFEGFSLADDPEGAWVAEDAGKVVGMAIAWTCGTFWYLADLFVLPDYQGKRVGQELIGRVLDHASRRGASNRALITFAFNRAALGMYVKHGLYPREPFYRVSADSTALAVRRHPTSPASRSSEPGRSSQR
jgi:GNAT superfamily N-acetyltransferase